MRVMGESASVALVTSYPSLSRLRPSLDQMASGLERKGPLIREKPAWRSQVRISSSA